MSETAMVERDEPGRVAAFLAYGLYLLSIPSAALLALVGVVIAYLARGTAGPNARAHLDYAVRLFWIAFAWGVGLFILTLIGWLLTIVLIGFPILWLTGLAAFLVMIWFTVMSLLGLIKLIERRAP